MSRDRKRQTVWQYAYERVRAIIPVGITDDEARALADEILLIVKSERRGW